MRENGFPRLKQLRSEIKLSQKEFASSIGLNLSTYNNYETGTREPNSDFWIAISRKYDVSIDYLLGLSSEKSPTPMRELEPDEYELLTDYRQMNESGKEAARNSIRGLTTIPDYKKSAQSKFLEKNA
ncbi:MAG TPA: helix-turn-helix transcriptional regulator [Caproicibacter sp.]|nr:helix-turn-helix transcriptional regulator [Caproicibacter sp.]